MDQEQTQQELAPRHAVGRAGIRRDVTRVGEQQHDDSHRRDAEHPTDEEGGTVAARRFENSIKMTAMIGSGLIAIPIARGRMSPNVSAIRGSV